MLFKAVAANADRLLSAKPKTPFSLGISKIDQLDLAREFVPINNFSISTTVEISGREKLA
jgi:hypothetical protein